MREFHELYILPLTMLTGNPVFPRLKITVLHHLVTVRAAAGERVDGYLPALRHIDVR